MINLRKFYKKQLEFSVVLIDGLEKWLFFKEYVIIRCKFKMGY